MRHFILLLFFTFTLYSSLIAQWESLGDDIIPESHRVWSLKLAPDHSIWVISTLDAFPPEGETPKIHRSADEGETWVNAEIPAAIDAYGWDISPIDRMNAFVAVDTAGLYQTVDGGMSWSKVDSYPFQAFYIHFFNQNEGWVVGADTTSLARLVMSLTVDGGQSWINTGNGIGLIEGTSLPVGSNDFFPFTYSLKSSYDIHENTILLGRSAGNYWKSTDKGYNWTNHDTPLKDLDLWTSNVTMKDSTTFMVVGDSNDFFNSENSVSFATKDGGQTWIEGRPGMTAAATQYIPDTDSIFIMTSHANFGFGDQGAVISYDYGENWERIDFGTRILAIDFIDHETGIGGCCNHDAWNNGEIYKWNFELPTATKEVVNSNKISLSPNPVSDRLFIEIGEDISSNEIYVDIISTNGQVLKRGLYPTESQFELDVSDLPKGFYLLKIFGINKLFSSKFIKN